MKFGLSSKIILNNFLVLFLTLIVVIFISNNAFEKTLYNSIGAGLKNYADETAFAIDHYIYGCIEELKIISQADVFEKKKPKQISQYLNEILKESSSFILLLVVNENGDLISLATNKNEESMNPIVQSLLKSFYLKGLSFAKQGEVFYEDHIRIIDKFYPYLLTPLTDDTNIIVEGALIGIINTTFIKQEVDRIDDRTIGDKAAYLVDDPGNVLYSREPGIKLFSSLLDIEAQPKLRKLLEGDRSGFIEYIDYKGDSVIAGYSDLSEYGKNQGGDWSIISIAPIDRAMLNVFKVRDWLYIIALFALIFGGLTAYILSQRILRPIRSLVSASKKLAKGDWNTNITVTTDDEIAELAQSFNRMARNLGEREEKLKDYSKNLEALVKKLQQSESIISSSTDMIALLDKNYTYLAVNPHYLRSVNKKREQLIGKKVENVFGEQFFKEIIKPHADRCMAGKEVQYQEWFDIPAFGKRFMEIIYYPHFDDDKTIKGFVVSGKDITERKQAEEVLKKYQFHLEELVESRTSELEVSIRRMNNIFEMPLVGIIVSTLGKGFIEVNNRICKMTGYSKDELLGMTWDDITHPSNLEQVTNLLLKLFSGEIKNFILEIKYIKKGGDVIDVEISIGYVRYDDASLDYLVAMIQDISKRKKLEVKKEKLDKDKTRFLSMAAHEFRTPLTTIQGFSEILITKKNIEPKDRIKYLAFIHEESEQLSNIINDLLNISRIESGEGFSLNKTLSNIMFTIKEILYTFKTQYPSRQFSMDHTVNIDATWNVDRGKMWEIFNNLYSNAIKYSPEGGLISTKLKLINGFVKIEIKDQGIGMTSEQVNKAFDKFYRAEVREHTIQGTGLGMTIVKYGNYILDLIKTIS